MYKNIPDSKLDSILNDAIELAKFNTMRSNGFMDRNKTTGGLFEDDDEGSIDTEPAPGPKLVVFDGESEDMNWEKFKPKPEELQDSDEEPEDSELLKKIKDRVAQRIKFWTEEDPIFANGKSKPDNTIEYFLQNEFNKNGTRKRHPKDKVMCEICGCAIRRSLTTTHLRTKKHRRTAAELDMRIQSRLHYNHYNNKDHKLFALPHIPTTNELNEIIQRKVEEMVKQQLAEKVKKPLNDFK